MKNLVQVLAVVFGLAILAAFTIPQDQPKGKPWDIPEKYKKMENPVKGDKSTLKIGKMMYTKHCKSCHGAKGLGDGPKAPKLKTFPGNFSSKEFKAFSDGELFYMITVGRDEMESYTKKIPDEEDIWAVINFIRTL